MAVFRNGTKVTRCFRYDFLIVFSNYKNIAIFKIKEMLQLTYNLCFRPDFVLVRQNLRDAGEEYRSILLGLKFGGVPSINSLNAIYNFHVSNRI